MNNMEDRIKDYLHLYLGCETNYGKLVGLNSHRAFVELKDGYITDGDVSALKPILRKLSDMSEEEVKEYLLLKFNALQPTKLSVQKHENGFWYAFKEQMPFEVDLRKFIFIAEIRDNNYPEQTIWLLSKSFDLFNLIDNNLAIDKTSLTPREQVNK